MKIFLVFFVCVMMLGGGSSTEAEVFSPTRLEIDNSFGQSGFDYGEGFEFRINVIGKPAIASFCVFTNNEFVKIGENRNGYLGWHQINKIDTCIYRSTFYDLEVGRNTLVWDGKALDGNSVDCQDMQLYLWAIDRSMPIQKAINNIEFSNYHDNKARIISLGENGLPLANPIIYKAEKRAYIGSNFNDSTLVELSTILLDEGWEWQGAPQILHYDHDYFNLSVFNREKNVASIMQLKWIPNGTAEIQRDWGEENGYAELYTINGGTSAGVVSQIGGYYLYTTGYNQILSGEPSTNFNIYDLDGSLITDVDLSEWWSSPDDYEDGGQLNGGPTNIAIGGKARYRRSSYYVFINSHTSCLNQMVDPVAYLDSDNIDDFFVWSNGNGDYFLDKNFEETAERHWVCNDYSVGPYANSIAADKNLFSVVGLTKAGPRSFAVLAPDGTGIGYGTLENDSYENGYSNFLLVDSDTAYDGMYFETTTNGNKNYYYQAYFSINRGFFIQCAVDDETTPAPFTLSQNSPNPFNPVTSIPFDLTTESKVTLTIYNVAGETVAVLADATLGAGSHSYDWDASKVASGMYFYKLDVGEYSRTMKMTVVR